MEFDIYVYLPIAFLVALLVAERIAFRSSRAFSGRDASILGLYGLGWIIKIILATHLLIPYLKLLVPIQIYSLASWEVALWINATACFLAIDLIQYWNHRVHHLIAPLWRLHRLHHSDKEMDTLTNWRHHPVEYISGWFLVTAVFILFDLPMIVIAAYALVAGTNAAFSHSRFTLPSYVSRVIEWVFVTPNAHRVHHSLELKESNSNFGTVFLFWDRLFGTYVAREKATVDSMRLGIDDNQSPATETLFQFLANPLQNVKVPKTESV